MRTAVQIAQRVIKVPPLVVDSKACVGVNGLESEIYLEKKTIQKNLKEKAQQRPVGHEKLVTWG